MGKVYRARDTRLERTVAIKFLHGRAVDDPDRRMRFLREARAEAALYHPNIATVLDVGEAEVDDPDLMPASNQQLGGRPTRIVPYLVLEFVAGKDLRSHILDGPLPLAETLRLARQIAAGLEAAHAAGIVHRDLKPANVLVTATGLVKILDFGLARFVAPAPPTADSPTDLQTAEGAILGTPPYLAPEQAVGQPLDARADLFALGVMLFQMTTGTLPFRGDNPIDLLQSALRDEPFDLAEKAPGTPPRFAALVAKLLKKHPIDRPASAAEVARELDAIAHALGDLPTSVTGAAGPQTPSTLAARRLSRRSYKLAAAAALAALAAAAYPMYERQRSRAESRSLYEEGLRTLELGDPQAFRLAAEQFGRAASIDPKFVVAWAERASALVRAYEDDRVAELLSEAEASARKAVELAPESIPARLAEARVQRSRGRASNAIESLTPLISTAGNDLVDVHAELAFSYEQAGDPRKAEEHFLAAVAARPGFWQPWNELGRFRTRMGNYPGARSAFERARELAPASKTAPSENLATLLVYEGKYDEALSAYESIAGGVADAEAASNLATLYFFNGRFADADRSYRRAIQISPRQPIYHRNLADTLLRLQRVEEATKEYALALDLVDRLLQSNATDVELRLQRALYLARAGRCPEAVAYASELGRTLSESAAIEHALSRPFALCGRNLEAIDHLQRAVALGFMPASLRQEDELAGLRDEPAFKRLVDGTGGVTAGRD